MLLLCTCHLILYPPAVMSSTWPQRRKIILLAGLHRAHTQKRNTFRHGLIWRQGKRNFFGKTQTTLLMWWSLTQPSKNRIWCIGNQANRLIAHYFSLNAVFSGFPESDPTCTARISWNSKDHEEYISYFWAKKSVCGKAWKSKLWQVFTKECRLLGWKSWFITYSRICISILRFGVNQDIVCFVITSRLWMCVEACQIDKCVIVFSPKPCFQKWCINCWSTAPCLLCRNPVVQVDFYRWTNSGCMLWTDTTLWQSHSFECFSVMYRSCLL